MNELKNYGPYVGENDYRRKMDKDIRPFLEIRKEEGTMETFDHKKLHYVIFPGRDEKAAVTIIHGKGEFYEKFEEMIYYLLNQGYGVYFLEQRGFGKSDRLTDDAEKVHVDSFDDYVRDQWDFFWKIVMKKSSSDIKMVLGHSMGGLIAARFLEVHPQAYRAAVLSAPMIRVHYGNIPRFAVKLLCLYGKLFKKQKEYAKGQHGYRGSVGLEKSADNSEARFNEYQSFRDSRPDCRTTGVSYGWIIESRKMSEKVIDDAEKISVPMIILQAEKDLAVDLDAQLEFAAYANDPLVVQFPESKHEIYAADDEERFLYYDWILSFYEENLSNLKRL